MSVTGRLWLPWHGPNTRIGETRKKILATRSTCLGIMAFIGIIGLAPARARTHRAAEQHSPLPSTELKAVTMDAPFTEPPGSPDGTFCQGIPSKPDCEAYGVGTIAGCGTGTFILDNTDGIVDIPHLNHSNGRIPAFNRWHVRPGSGPGGLTGLVSGSGVNYETLSLIATDDSYGIGSYTGSVTCLVRTQST